MLCHALKKNQRFETTLECLDWVSNYEKTRWFLVLRVRKPSNDGLNRLLRICNYSVAKFNQPVLYETTSSSSSSQSGSGPRRKSKPVGKPQQTQAGKAGSGSGPAIEEDFSHCFHISIAWCLEEPSAEDKRRVAGIDITKLGDLRVSFDSLKVKIGNVVSSLKLPTKVLDDHGFCGI